MVVIPALFIGFHTSKRWLALGFQPSTVCWLLLGYVCNPYLTKKTEGRRESPTWDLGDLELEKLEQVAPVGLRDQAVENSGFFVDPWTEMGI